MSQKEKSIDQLAFEWVMLIGKGNGPTPSYKRWELREEAINRVGNLHWYDAIEKAHQIKRMIFDDHRT